MQLPDLTTAQTILALCTALVAVLGSIFGWFDKAWRGIQSLWERQSPDKGKLLFFVDQLHGAYWGAASNNGKPGLQIVINLEASNTTDYPCRIMAARILGRKASMTVLGVQDIKTNMYGHVYPIPAHRIVKMTVQFIFQTPTPEQPTEVLKGRLEFLDHNTRKHRIPFVAHGPQRVA